MIVYLHGDEIATDFHATAKDLYFDLKPLSSNAGEVDYNALIEGRHQKVCRNRGGRFQLFRIGDAVSARNTHAAIYDALRLMKDI